MAVTPVELEQGEEPMLLLLVGKNLRVAEVEGVAAPYVDRRYIERFARGAVFLAKAFQALVSQYLWSVGTVSMSVDLGDAVLRLEEGPKGIALGVYRKAE